MQFTRAWNIGWLWMQRKIVFHLPYFITQRVIYSFNQSRRLWPRTVRHFISQWHMMNTDFTLGQRVRVARLKLNPWNTDDFNVYVYVMPNKTWWIYVTSALSFSSTFYINNLSFVRNLNCFGQVIDKRLYHLEVSSLSVLIQERNKLNHVIILL